MGLFAVVWLLLQLYPAILVSFSTRAYAQNISSTPFPLSPSEPSLSRSPIAESSASASSSRSSQPSSSLSMTPSMSPSPPPSSPTASPSSAPSCVLNMSVVLPHGSLKAKAISSNGTECLPNQTADEYANVLATAVNVSQYQIQGVCLECSTFFFTLYFVIFPPNASNVWESIENSNSTAIKNAFGNASFFIYDDNPTTGPPGLNKAALGASLGVILGVAFLYGCYRLFIMYCTRPKVYDDSVELPEDFGRYPQIDDFDNKQSPTIKTADDTVTLHSPETKSAPSAVNPSVNIF